jgi:DNA-binding NarL/FixJ family response regulator
LLAENNGAILDRVRALLASEFEITGTVRDGLSLVSRALELKPDVIVMDIAMPQLDGIQATREIKKHHPEVKIVFLTMHDRAGLLLDAVAAGGLGYVLKACASTDLVVAVREALAGRSYISPLAEAAADLD